MSNKSLRWLESAQHKWHAWPIGGRKSLCSTLTVEDLRTSPALRISEAPAADGVLCSTCRRKAGVVTPSTVSGITAAWLGLLRRHLLRIHVRVAEATLIELAARLAEVGNPGEQAAREVFSQVQVLMLNPLRSPSGRHSRTGRALTVVTIPYLKEAIAKLPPKTGALTQVAATLRLWRHLTNRDPRTDRGRPDRIVEVMLQLPTQPESYIRHLMNRGLPNLSAMFHPNTLARAKKETALRGLFAGSNDYWTKTKNQLHVEE